MCINKYLGIMQSMKLQILQTNTHTHTHLHKNTDIQTHLHTETHTNINAHKIPVLHLLLEHNTGRFDFLWSSTVILFNICDYLRTGHWNRNVHQLCRQLEKILSHSLVIFKFIMAVPCRLQQSVLWWHSVCCKCNDVVNETRWWHSGLSEPSVFVFIFMALHLRGQ
jgi:hypothetical protein